MEYESWNMKAIVGIFLIVAIILNFSLYLHFGYAFGGDQSLNKPSLLGVFDSLFIWQPNNYSGLMTSTTGPLGFILGLLNLPYILGLKYGYILSTSLYYWIGAFGIFLLVSEFKTKSSKNAFYGGLIAAIIASFVFFSHLKTFSAPIIFLPYVVIFMLLFVRQFDMETSKLHNKNKLTLYSACLSVFIGLMIYTDFGDIIQNTAFLVIFAIVIVLISRSNRIRLAKYIAIAILIGFLINLNLLATTYLFVHSIGNSFFSTGAHATLNAYAIPFQDSLIAFGTPYGAPPVQYLIQIMLVIIGISGVIFYIVSNKKTSEANISLSLITLYLFFLGFLTTIHKPFGMLFNYMLSKIPYLLTLRFPSAALHYIFLFFIASFVGISFISLMDYVATHKNPLKRRLYTIAIIILFTAVLSAYVYIFDIIPISTNVYQGIPSHVFEISDYINSQNGYFSVGVLPLSVLWQDDNWYFGTNIYSALIKYPVYTGGYTNYNEFFFPATKQQYFNATQAVGSGNLSHIDFSNELGIFGIHYLIVQGDALHKPPCGACSVTSFSKSDILNNLDASNDIKLVNEYGNSSIYVNTNYVPLVYATNVKVLPTNTVNQTDHYIANSSFSIQNYSIYDPVALDEFNPVGKIGAYTVQSFFKPSISFSYPNPAKAIVHVHNATTPFYLIFRETYDPHWAAFFSNGTEVNPRDHIAVNGFANAWYMNKTGNYTVTLYYTLQTDAWLAWGVSFAALFVTIGIGVYGWRRDHA